QPHWFVVDRLAPMLQERIPDALHITRAYECPEKIRRQFKPIRLNGRIESFRKLGPKLRVADHMLPVAMRTVAIALGDVEGAKIYHFDTPQKRHLQLKGSGMRSRAEAV